MADAPQDPTEASAPHDAAFEHGASAGVTDPALASLLDEHWAWTMRNSPLWASALGDRSGDGKLGDGSPAAIAAQRAERQAFLERARALQQSGGLNRADALTNRIFVLTLDNEIAVDGCGFEQWSLSPRNNPVTALGYLPEIRPLEGAHDLDKLVARYQAMAPSIRDEVANLKLGAQAGRFANAESTQRVLDMVTDQLATPTNEWAAVTAVTWVDAAPEGAQDALIAVLDTDVRPALHEYAELIEGTILPSARTGGDAGLTGLGDDGGSCYSALIRSHTSLDKTADEIHQIGLDELAKIHAEFAVIGQRVWGTSDRAQIFEKLRTDPALYFETAEQVEAKAADALAQAKAKMPEYFGRLPEADCVVKRVPEHEAPYTTVAYYRQPAADGSRPGEYRINVHAPETRPRHEAAVLAYHESIPGHHLQIAIAQELPELPAFRRHDGTTAYVEGWALYTERLADEMGLYQDDVDRLGMLSYDAWRASRLVVDTGVHHKGWTREQAVLFMIQNTPLAPNNIDNEVDRYISWPGQALAYKLGQLEIWRLRRLAEDALRDDFDIRGFHDVVLSEGAVPLGVLESNVRQWVDGQVR